jgi:hypothetical protein
MKKKCVDSFKYIYIDLQSRAIYDDKTNSKKSPHILEDGA